MKKQQRHHASHPAGYGFFSITNQLRYGLVLLVVIAMLLVSGTLTYLSFQAQMQQLEVAQQEISQAAAAKINAYIDDLQRKLSYLARVQGLTDLSPEIQQKFLAALTRHHSAYETVAILDSQGKVISAVSPYGQFKVDKITPTPGILSAIKQKEDFVSPVEIDPATKLPIVTLAVPIRNIADEVNGVLIARINLKFLRFFIYQTQVGETGYTYVIDNRNFLIAVKEEYRASLKLRDLSAQPFIEQFQRFNRDKFLAKYRGLKGVEVIGAVSPITSLRWQVVVELPVNEAYAPIRQMLLVMGVFIFIATLVTVGVGIRFQRQIVLPLERLTTAAARISTGDLNTQINVIQRNEMGVLAATFNQMTLQLRELIQDLSQERNFVSAVLDTVGALVIVVDSQGRIARFNRTFEQISKYSFAEVENKLFWDLFLVPEELELVKTDFQNLIAEQTPKITERYLLTKDRKQRLISWSTTTLLDDTGKISYVIGTGLDITERRQAEIQLRAGAERERLIAEIALRILWSLNLEAIINITVTEVRQFLQADRVFISNFKDDLHKRIFAESLNQDWESIADLFTTDHDYLQEIKILFSQGDIQQIDDISHAKISSKRAYYFTKYQVKACLTVPIMVNNEFFGTLVAHQCSKVRHWQQVEIDLLQQLATQVAIAIQQAKLFQEIQALNVNLERKVEARTAQLQQKMMELQDLYKRQDEFLHAVSHDLRTPITGTLMLLKHWQQSPIENISLPRHILDRMIESGERQLYLINSLLETHVSESQGITLHYEPVKIAELVNSIAEDLESLLIKNQASITNLVLSNLPLVNADTLQLRRVFENLISNALNHNPPGLEITLKANVEGEMICCLVQDNGVGMSEAQGAQIFERYARGDRARSLGIGLGLYLCRQIITAHGGEIGVQSSPGQGATFWFTLPCHHRG
ncbi:multi-sensor signal transduction histidine kinase [Calothrix sp. NIES-2100]|uniref:cache domain-containing protein n=1 Tax=Calothrix sp. NIES-2100 TaxID=1954172 RepID=UPI000B5F56C4|nr:multi-sensor signal transduction histidine kinase [Calothrix sp. NIES-2100]